MGQKIDKETLVQETSGVFSGAQHAALAFIAGAAFGGAAILVLLTQLRGPRAWVTTAIGAGLGAYIAQLAARESVARNIHNQLPIGG